MKKDANKFGHFIFAVGLGICLLAGIILPDNYNIAIVLVLLGIIVGSLNIQKKESNEFLISTIALVVSAGAISILPFIGTLLKAIIEYFLALIAPAATLVALLKIYRIAEK
jgi:hypothetical protein